MTELVFLGKEIIHAHHLKVPPRALLQDMKKSCNPRRNSDNMIIHGNNLDALKSLLPMYRGMIKCIYIDPPYNTSNSSWIYPDNIDHPRFQDWSGKEVSGDDLDKHDKWLCMMWPRLQLLKELLSNDGLIFISINYIEVEHLTVIMNEIFGKKNFKNNIVVKRGTSNIQSQFDSVDTLKSGYESILLYSKSSDYRIPKPLKIVEEKPGSWNNHWRGVVERKNLQYELLGVKPDKGAWRWSEERSLKAVENYEEMKKNLKTQNKELTQNNIDDWYMENKDLYDGKLNMLRLSDSGVPEHFIAPSRTEMLTDDWTDLNGNGSRSLEKMEIEFDNPKSVSLLERVLDINTKNDDIVLDSFAGSGTTAHAVMRLNARDGGKRRFILIEHEDYTHRITAERVRKVIKGIPNTKNKEAKRGFGGSFTYYTLGKAMDKEKMLKGDLPEYKNLAAYLLYKVGIPTDGIHVEQTASGLFYKDTNTDYYLLYEPNVDMLKDDGCTLTEGRINKIEKRGRNAVVFAPDANMSQLDLTKRKIEFSRIPYPVGGA